jgi:hypothetical protein
MAELIRILGGRIVDAGVAAGLIAGLVALAMIATRQPSRRRAIARAGILGILLTIPIACLHPFAPIDLAGPIRLGVATTLAWIGELTGGLRPIHWPSGLRPPSWLGRFVPIALLFAYFAAVLAGLGRMTLGWWGSGWIGRNSEPASPEAAAMYASLPYVSGRERPRLRVSTRTRRPVLLGTFRPTILIPPDLDAPDAAESLRLTLLHELAHAEASDPWFGLAVELASAFWFWLPPLWWIRAQMRLDQEFLADRQASVAFGAKNRYASSLVEIAASPARDGEASRERRPKAAGTSLFPRVLMLVRCPFPVEASPPRWWKVTLVASTVIVLMLATSVTLRIGVRGAQTPSPTVESLSVARFVLTSGGSPVAPTTLPIRLPPRFDLSFAVHATAAQLAQIRVLGYPLGTEPRVDNSLIQVPAQWHRVRLHREAETLTLAVDAANLSPLPGRSADEWLTVQGTPDGSTVLSSIHLTW